MKVKIELTFPGELKDEAIICHLCKKFDIILSILEASFSTDVGWAVLVLSGSEEEIKKSFEFLREKGVEIKESSSDK